MVKKSTSTRTTKPRQQAKPKQSTAQKKTNMSLFSSVGTSKWHVIIPIFILLLVGAFGVWKTYFSGATTALSSEQCYLRGRSYSSGNCAKTCLSGAGSLKYGSAFDWCSNAISTSLSSATCNNKGRKYVSGTGCARRWQQTNAKGAKQCISGTATYIVASVDYCKGASGDPTPPSGADGNWGWPVSPNRGVSIYGAYYSSTGAHHYARDFVASNGAEVRAVANGTIVKKEYMSAACGNALIMKVKLPSGTYVYPVYEHLRYSSASGAVTQGQVIGWVTSPPSGTSGGCWFGYHLHLGVQYQGGYVESHRTDPSAHPDACQWISGC